MAVLDVGVANKNEGAGLEVIVLDDILLILDELCNRLVSCLLDLSPNLLEVLLPALELSCSKGQKVGRGCGLVDRGKVGGFGQIEWEYGLDSMDNIKGSFVSGALDGYSLGPEHRVNVVGPLRGLIATHLHERFPNRQVLSLDNTIRSRVVPRYADMSDPISAIEDLEGSHEWGPVVRDELCQ